MSIKKPEGLSAAFGNTRESSIVRQDRMLEVINRFEEVAGYNSKLWDFVSNLQSNPEKFAVKGLTSEKVKTVAQEIYQEMRNFREARKSFSEWMSAPNQVPLEDENLDAQDWATIRGNTGNFFSRPLSEHVEKLKWVLQAFDQSGLNTSDLSAKKLKINMEKFDEMVMNYQELLKFMYKVVHVSENAK
jgi:hypothetical protein